eukprot:249597-Chlamydomonas_euryale.AAC.1
MGSMRPWEELRREVSGGAPRQGLPAVCHARGVEGLPAVCHARGVEGCLLYGNPHVYPTASLLCSLPPLRPGCVMHGAAPHDLPA